MSVICISFLNNFLLSSKLDIVAAIQVRKSIPIVTGKAYVAINPMAAFPIRKAAADLMAGMFIPMAQAEPAAVKLAPVTKTVFARMLFLGMVFVTLLACVGAFFAKACIGLG